ncbi:MAG: hypothetical protein SWN98_11750 [Pseudomonadota bacterium]|nr:hypothetical protein [Pseudomonadota bacterium]
MAQTSDCLGSGSVFQSDGSAWRRHQSDANPSACLPSKTSRTKSGGQKRKVDHLLDTPLSDVFSACDLAIGPVGSLVNTPVSSIRLIVSA